MAVGGKSCAFLSASTLALVSAFTLSTPVSSGVVGVVTGVVGGVTTGALPVFVVVGAGVVVGGSIGFVILSEKTGAGVCPVVLGGVVVGLRLAGFDILGGTLTVTPLFTTPLPQITLDCHGLAASVV